MWIINYDDDMMMMIYRVITTFQGRNPIYEQKNSSSPNHVPVTLKTVFRE